LRTRSAREVVVAGGQVDLTFSELHAKLGVLVRKRAGGQAHLFKSGGIV
jgi:hypothetical protein